MLSLLFPIWMMSPVSAKTVWTKEKITPTVVRQFINCANQVNTAHAFPLGGEEVTYYIGSDLMIYLNGKNKAVHLLSPYFLAQKPLDKMKSQKAESKSVYKLPQNVKPRPSQVYQISFPVGESQPAQYQLIFSYRDGGVNFMSNGPCRLPCGAKNRIAVPIPKVKPALEPFGQENELWPKDHASSRIDPEMMAAADASQHLPEFFAQYRFPTTESKAGKCGRGGGKCIPEEIPITKEGKDREIQIMKKIIAACEPYAQSVSDNQELLAQIHALEKTIAP